MRRATTIALILTVAIPAAPAGLTLAHGKPESPGAHGRARAALHEPGPPAETGARRARDEGDLAGDARGHEAFEPELVAQVQPVGVAGSFLNVRAKARVRGPRDAATVFTATATVHFASGDVAVDLARMGSSLVARALVPIASDEQAGEVSLSVVVSYGDAVATFELATSVVAGGSADDPTEPDEDAEPDEPTEPDEPAEPDEDAEPDASAAEGTRLAMDGSSRPAWAPGPV